jgi:hypothetical protein
MVIPNKIKCLIVSFSGNSEYLASMEVKQTSIPTMKPYNYINLRIKQTDKPITIGKHKKS